MAREPRSTDYPCVGPEVVGRAIADKPAKLRPPTKLALNGRSCADASEAVQGARRSTKSNDRIRGVPWALAEERKVSRAYCVGPGLDDRDGKMGRRMPKLAYSRFIPVASSSPHQPGTPSRVGK